MTNLFKYYYVCLIDLKVEFPTKELRDNTSSYSEKELNKLISSKSPEVTSILTEIISHLPALKEQLKKVEDVANSLPSNLDNGISLFDLKSEFLLSYNQLLFVYMLQKLEGADLKNHPLLESLVRSRYAIIWMFDVDHFLKSSSLWS